MSPWVVLAIVAAVIGVGLSAAAEIDRRSRRRRRELDEHYREAQTSPSPDEAVRRLRDDDSWWSR